MPTPADRPDRVLAGPRFPLLRPLRRLPVRPLLLDLERVEPPALPGAAVRRPGQVGRPAQLREARCSGVRRDQGREPAGQGRDRQYVLGRPRQAVLAGKSATHSPARFARLVAAANPRLKFDAWAQHPYPVPVNLKPTQLVRYPNVTLKSFPRFEKDLDKWFKRTNVRIWITEYGHEVQPGRGAERHLARGASRLRGAGARAGPSATRGRTCSSGSSSATMPRASGRAVSAPAPARRSRRSRSSPRSRAWSTPGTRSSTSGRGRQPDGAGLPPPVRGRLPAGRAVGFNVKVYEKGKLIADAQPSSPLALDATGKVRLLGFRPVKGHTYTVQVTANIFSGGGVELKRTLTVNGV